jgi:hypothetical protein
MPDTILISVQQMAVVGEALFYYSDKLIKYLTDLLNDPIIDQPFKSFVHRFPKKTNQINRNYSISAIKFLDCRHKFS